jgi:hypothetical protein
MSTLIVAAPACAGSWEQVEGRMHRRSVEVLHAMANLRAGHHPRDLLCSLATLIEATQALRAERPSWGACFIKDPRRFSSTPRIATPEQVGAFIDGVRIQ